MISWAFSNSNIQLVSTISKGNNRIRKKISLKEGKKRDGINSTNKVKINKNRPTITINGNGLSVLVKRQRLISSSGANGL